MPEEAVIEKIEKPTRSSVIAEAVAAADAEVAKDEQTVETEVKKTPPVPAKTEEKKPEVKTEEVDEDKMIAEQGKALMQALKDPLKAPIVIKFLAEQAGYSKSAVVETKTDVKEMKNDILDDLREGLGEEFSIIADRLAPAIEKILTKQLEKNNKDIREKFQEQETEKLRGQSAAVISKLSDEFFGAGEELPDEVSKEMSKFMDRVAPAPNSSIKEYVEDSFHFAVGKLGLTKVSPNQKAKIEKNRSDAPSRLASARIPASNSLTRDNAKPMTRQEAIQAAIDAVNKGD